MKNYVSCHCHQSSLDTASTPEAFAKKELELGTGYLTVTDHGTLNAARKVYDLGKKKGLTPIIGLEAYLRDDDCPILRRHGILPQHPTKEDEPILTEPKTLAHYAKYFHLTMHAQDATAYEKMVSLLSKADERAERHGSERKPLFTWADVEELGGHNITMTSSCLVGVVQRHLVDHGNFEIAMDYYEKLRGVCKPGNFYVEVFPHKCDHYWDSAGYITFADGSRERIKPWKKLKFEDGKEAGLSDWAKRWKRGEQNTLLATMENRKWKDRDPKIVTKVEVEEGFLKNDCQPWAEDGDLQKGANTFLLAMAERYGDPILIGDDSHYAEADEKVVQDIRLQAGGGSWRFHGHYHRQSSAESLAHFQETLGVQEKEFEGWVENTHRWAESFKGFSFKDRKSLPTSFYPEDTFTHTLALVEKHGRMQWDNPEWVARLTKEIEMLHENGKLDLLPYFMIDEEVCSLYGQAGKLTGPGRGSAAGMLLAYLLRITHVDPIKHGLSMERFLTASRIRSGKLPDIDQDLPDRELLVGTIYDGWELTLSTGETVKVKYGSQAVIEAPTRKGETVTVSVEDAIKRKSQVFELVDLGRGRASQAFTIENSKKIEVHEPGWLDQRFGACYAAISTDVSLKLRSAVKDVARVMSNGLVPQEIEALTRKFPNAPQGISDYDFVFGYKGSDGWVEGILATDPALVEYTNKYPRQWEVVQKCLGLTRQKSKHACAYVIADEPISNFIPLTRVGKDLVTVTQYTAGSVEAVGGLKMDFLVINSLKDIAAAIKLIQSRSGWAPEDTFIDGEKVLAHEIVPTAEGLRSVWKLPEDQAVFRDFCEGKTETVFQFNTPGAVGWLKHFDRVKEVREDGTIVKALDSIEALSAFTALDRPGPLDFFVEGPEGAHNMLVEFARRAAGQEPVGEIPALTTIIPETYGVITYQEQLQKIFYTLGKTTLEEADEFRIHISKKQMAKVIEDKKVFMKGAVESVGEETAQTIWNSMETFGQYGFNKSHSTAYVIIAYACAYLKHHFPLEWWTAVLRHADKDEIAEKFWAHCGHLIDLPDIALSGKVFDIVNGRIRAPLSILYGVGEAAHKQLTAGAPYSSVKDFCEKILKHKEDNTTFTKVVATTEVVAEDGTVTKKEEVVDRKRAGTSAINKGVIATLIVSGAMDSLFPEGTTTTEALDIFALAMSTAKGKKRIMAADKFPPELSSLNTYSKYQMKKAVLPAFHEDLLPTLERIGHQNLTLREGSLPEFEIGEGSAPFVSRQELQHLANKKPWPSDYVVATSMIGYVLDVRRFEYGEGKSREALEVVLDADGGQIKMVKWGGKTGKLPDEFKNADQAIKGAIVVIHAAKYNEDRPFTLEALHVIQPPLGLSKEETPTPDE